MKSSRNYDLTEDKQQKQQQIISEDIECICIKSKNIKCDLTISDNDNNENEEINISIPYESLQKRFEEALTTLLHFKNKLENELKTPSKISSVINKNSNFKNKLSWIGYGGNQNGEIISKNKFVEKAKNKLNEQDKIIKKSYDQLFYCFINSPIINKQMENKFLICRASPD